MNIIYIISAFAAGFLVSYFICTKIQKLKFDIEKIKLQDEIETLKGSAKSTDDILNVVKSEFVNLANAAILEKQQLLEETSTKKLDTHLNPLKERILEFQKKVEEFNVSGVKNTNIIKEQITSLTNENNLIRMQAQNLTQAFKGNSKSRGLLGEMILENILKSSGLENKNENPVAGAYVTQKSFRSLDDENGAKIMPDVVVYFPFDNKNIVIDSKLSLVDFLNLMECEDKEEEPAILKRFYKSVEDRVNELAGKYNNLEGLSTPDFTLMFVPLESSITYIYSNQKLIENAYKKGVIITGPASLIATLRVIKYCWAQKNQEKNVREILKLGENIYSKVVTLIGAMEKLQTNFVTMQKTFAGIFTTLTGRGGLISQTEKLKDYGASPVGAIEQKYLEEEVEI